MDNSYLDTLPSNDAILKNLLSSNKAIVDDGMESWNKIVEILLEKSSNLIALRGAGSINGMDKNAIDLLINNDLIPRIENLLNTPGLVIILFDGDADDIAKPDIGYVAGRLLDHFGNSDSRVIFLTAQKESWYPKDLNGGNLGNSNGSQYITYVFPNNTYPGDHNNFTQNVQLVESGKYQQWYIGASGQIANSQLKDYNDKVEEGSKCEVKIFKVKNNPELDADLQNKLKLAEESENTTDIGKIQAKIDQRKNVYGAHWNNDGTPSINIEEYPGLNFEFIG